MAITYFGRTAVPTDGGSNVGPTVTIAPPASMVADDFVLVLLTYKTTATNLTFSATTTGGQTWTSETKIATTTLMSQWFKCKYNGTWDANPVFTISSGAGNVMGGVMLVFRGVDTTTAIDNADASAAYTAPADPFDVTITGIDPTTDGSFVVAAWASVDDNSWTVQTAGWTNPSSEAQWKNLGGTDLSISVAYKEIASGASGNIVNRQHTITGDNGSTHIIAIRSAVTALSLTMPTIASGAALNVPTLTPGAVALTMPTIASGASINVPTLKQVIALPTIASGASLNVPTVAPGAVNLTMPTIASAAALTAPALSPGAVALTMPTIATGEATNAPTLTAGAVSVTLPTIASEAALNAPTLTAGAVSVALPVITSAATLFAPTVAPVVPDQLDLPAITGTAVLTAPTLTPGTIVITLPAIASVEQAFAPTLAVGAVALALPTIAAGSAVTVPALTVGTVAIDLPTIASGAALNAPAVMLVGPQAITLPTIVSGATLSVPTVGDMPTPVPPVIMVGGVSPSVYSQRIEPARVEQPRPKAQTLALPSIASVATLYAPGVSIDWLQVSQREDEELMLAGVL